MSEAGRVRSVLERLTREGATTSRLDGSTHDLFPVAIGADEGGALRRRVIDEHAADTIEVGLGFALSTLYIVEGLLSVGGPVRHVAIDPYQLDRYARCGLQHLEEAGASEIVTLIEEESQIALPRLIAEGERFDLAFVDGNHRFDGVFLDLIYLGRLVRPGGVVFVDDHQLPAVAKAVSFCFSNLEWEMEEISTVHELHHWAVLRLPREVRDRPFDHFVDF